jgi:hypothetical protein
VLHYHVDEGRKRVLLIAAAILAARKLAAYDVGKLVPATVSAIADAIRWAEEILKEIDRRWPSTKVNECNGDFSPTVSVCVSLKSWIHGRQRTFHEKLDPIRPR